VNNKLLNMNNKTCNVKNRTSIRKGKNQKEREQKVRDIRDENAHWRRQTKEKNGAKKVFGKVGGQELNNYFGYRFSYR
jgi:translation elongation factor P/translation initiation factor 5A